MSQLFHTLQHSQTIYDIIACLYGYIHSSYADVEKNRDIQWKSKVSDILLLVKEQCDDVEEVVFSFNFSTLLIRLMEQNEKCIKQICLEAIICLDNFFPFDKQKSKLLYSCKFEFTRMLESLNKNTKDYIIYPRSKNGTLEVYNNYLKEYGLDKLRENIQKYQNGINSNLKNYLIFCSAQLLYRPLLHFDLSTAKRLGNNVKVALFPLTQNYLDTLFNVSINEKSQSFSILEIKPDGDKKLYQLYKAALQKIFLKKDVDVVIFPEMLMTRAILKKIQALIKEYYYSGQAVTPPYALYMWFYLGIGQ